VAGGLRRPNIKAVHLLAAESSVIVSAWSNAGGRGTELTIIRQFDCVRLIEQETSNHFRYRFLRIGRV
jgi:hypothetical protein